MASWSHIADEAPALAALLEATFDARRMKTLATLRRDGTPRLSEISGASIRDGDAWLGVIPSAKERDLDRDPRCAVHCGSPTDDWAASGRLSARAERAGPEARERLGLAADGDEPRYSLFRLDVSEIVVTRPDPETGLILVEWWNEISGPGQALRQPG